MTPWKVFYQAVQGYIQHGDLSRGAAAFVTDVYNLGPWHSGISSLGQLIHHGAYEAIPPGMRFFQMCARPAAQIA